MSANEIINSLITRLDEDTLNHNPYGTLCLMGDTENSPFLRAIIKKADKFGIKTVNVDSFQSKHPMVIDLETTIFHPGIYILEQQDLDCIYKPGMSCVATAIYLLLKELNLISGKTITIVGRGHSVKGLAEQLIKDDATVTVAHSKTDSLLKATMSKDVVIYATPKINKVIAYDTDELIIDLGNCIEHPDWFNCEYVNGIGKLTVSVLLNRLVR